MKDIEELSVNQGIFNTQTKYFTVSSKPVIFFLRPACRREHLYAAVE
jgi:hypothetical protein